MKPTETTLKILYFFDKAVKINLKLKERMEIKNLGCFVFKNLQNKKKQRNKKVTGKEINDII
jgi:nucleoid DNA-binding protein